MNTKLIDPSSTYVTPKTSWNWRTRIREDVSMATWRHADLKCLLRVACNWLLRPAMSGEDVKKPVIFNMTDFCAACHVKRNVSIIFFWLLSFIWMGIEKNIFILDELGFFLFVQGRVFYLILIANKVYICLNENKFFFPSAYF